jgi:hypothetical protein
MLSFLPLIGPLGHNNIGLLRSYGIRLHHVYSPKETKDSRWHLVPSEKGSLDQKELEKQQVGDDA